MKFEMVSALFSEIEKLSVAIIATWVVQYFGGSMYLMLLVQYLFIFDFFVSIFSNFKIKNKYGLSIWQGLKKIISLYFGILIVGFGTHAFDVALQEKLDIHYSGAFIFDVFLFLLIIFILSSINSQLAKLGFPLNIAFEKFFDRIMLKVISKINKTIDEIADPERKNNENNQ